MHGPDPDPLISITEAATRLGIDRSVLSRQIKSGAVRSHGKTVRFSEVLADRAANIDLTRSGRREGRGEHQDQRPSQPRASARASRRASGDARPDDDLGASTEDEDDDAPETVLVDGQLMTTARARAMKETYLALRRKLEFEVQSGALIDGATAEKKVFELARNARDAWIAWPARVAVLMADAVEVDRETQKVEPRSLSITLDRFVRDHLNELGDPEDMRVRLTA